MTNYLNKAKSLINNFILKQDFFLNYQLRQNEILDIQHRFEVFKEVLNGEDVVIVATGPTLNNYVPKNNAIHIGVNKAYKRNDINYKYYFVQDYMAVKDYVQEIKINDCQMFFGRYIREQDILSVQIPDDIRKITDGIPYYSSWPIYFFSSDISKAPFLGSGTVTITAMQFALYAGAKRIYLVGCDTSQSGYFDKTKQRDVVNTMNVEKIIQDYKKFKDYAAIEFPMTDIISINPVGLKGIFKAEYI